MKTVRDYSLIPAWATYLGSTDGPCSMGESVADAIADAIDPVRLIDETGEHFFDVARETTE